VADANVNQILPTPPTWTWYTMLISYSLAVFLDFLAITLLFSFLLWKTSEKKKKYHKNLIQTASRTRTLRFYVIMFSFVMLILADFMFSSTELLTRILILALVGITLYKLDAGSKDLNSLLSIIAVFLLLYPKILVISDFPGSKLYSDAWGHYGRLLRYDEVGSFGERNYYTVLPIVYSHILFVSNVTGISVFYASTTYYLAINLLTALVLYITCKKLVKTENSTKSILPSVAVLLYSVVSYPNVSILRELPQSVGMVSVCLAMYVILGKKKATNPKSVVLSILVFFLSLAHPFAPIFICALYFLYKILVLLAKQRPRPPSFPYIILPFLVLYLYYSTLSIEQPVSWLWLSLSRGINILLDPSRWYTVTGHVGEVSLDVKYLQVSERVLYGVNWALPAAVGFSFAIVLGFCLLKEKDRSLLGNPDSFINAIALFSGGLSVLAFTFSFVEYSFARYFGTYALLISIPAIAYITEQALNRPKIFKILVIALVFFVALATLTDFDLMPALQTVYYNRDRRFSSPWVNMPELYAAQFLTNESSKSNATIYIDGTYIHAMRFFVNSISPLRQVSAFSYPATQTELQMLSKAKQPYYILFREARLISQGLIIGTIFYSNGEVYAIFRNSTGIS
jgi:hypothetical protein